MNTMRRFFAVLIFLLIVIGVNTVLNNGNDKHYRYKTNDAWGLTHDLFVINKAVVTVSVRNDLAVAIEQNVVTSDPVAISLLKSCLLELELNNRYARTDAQVEPHFYTITFQYDDGSSEVREYRMFMVSRYTNVFRDFYDYMRSREG